MTKDWKERLGVVYSTNQDFNYNKENDEQVQTLPPDKQNLKVMLDRKRRKGKSITLINGFVGNDDDLKELGKRLKTRCGSGGTVKEGEIMIQGDFCELVMEILYKEGYKVKRSGG